MLPIADLDLSVVQRVRYNISQETVDAYTDILDDLPPIDVAEIDGCLTVIAGLHRTEAHRLAGRAEVRASVRPMTRREALKKAVEDNKAQGLRMSRADKRASVELLLDELPDLASRNIADLVGCSHHTVEKVRASRQPILEVGNCPPDGEGETGPASAEVGDCPPELPAAKTLRPGPCPAPRRGRDGKTYRPKAQADRRPRAHPPASALQPEPVGMRAALLIDYRTKAAQVADYLRCVLREGAGHRAEALDLVLAQLDPDQLERLAARATAAAERQRQ